MSRRRQRNRSVFISSSGRSKSQKVPSCPASRSLAVLEALDREIQAGGLNRYVQLTTCGCMGLCDEGPVMAVYPTGMWYRRVQPSLQRVVAGSMMCVTKPIDWSGSSES